MAYNITLTNGTPLVTVADGTTNPKVSTSLTLVGKNYAGYGLFLNENFIQLLENFANGTEPPNALDGQIWWDTSLKTLKVRNSGIWKSVSGSTSSAITPATPTVGDLWWDTTNTQLKVRSGTDWITIGPAYTAATGQTGITADTILEAGGGQSHIIVKFWVANTVVAILSKDPTFTISSIPGFTNINPGFNLSTNNSLMYTGDASNALRLSGQPASSYLRSDIGGTVGGPILVTSDSGITIGSTATTGDLTLESTTASANISGKVSNKNVVFYVNKSGVPTPVMTLNAATGLVTVNSDPLDNFGVATKQFVINNISGTSSAVLARNGGNTITGTITPDVTSSRNFGSPSLSFSNIYATNFVGLASDSSKLGGVAASNFVRSDITQPVNTPLNLVTNSGLTLGAGGDFTIDVTSSPNSVNLRGNTNGKDLSLYVNAGGVNTKAINVVGTTGLATVTADPTDPLGIATKQYVDTLTGGSAINLGQIQANIVPLATATYSLGNATKKWTTVYATTFAGNATTANYADLAERFEADGVYIPGTIVKIGGEKEITVCNDDASPEAFGVISSDPAYLMNNDAGNDRTHPAVALAGRVPVRVIGTVVKGDRLVSAGDGVARAAYGSDFISAAVIGRALENKDTTDEGLILAVVKANI